MKKRWAKNGKYGFSESVTTKTVKFTEEEFYLIPLLLLKFLSQESYKDSVKNLFRRNKNANFSSKKRMV